MKLFMNNGAGKQPIPNNRLSFAQSKQAAAIMDSIGRLIPQEGVDYDVHITFKGEYNPSVSMDIVALTEKGQFWRKYISHMISKYPPRVDYQGEVLPDNPSPSDYPETAENEEEENGKEQPQVGN